MLGWKPYNVVIDLDIYRIFPGGCIPHAAVIPPFARPDIHDAVTFPLQYKLVKIS